MSEAEITQYIDQQKKFHEAFISFISDDEPTKANLEYHFKNILKFQPNLKVKGEFRSMLIMISQITKEHHRCKDFYSRIEKILVHYSSQIKETFTNFEIFQVFISSKLVLLILFEQKIITPDQSFIPDIMERSTIYTDENSSQSNELSVATLYRYDNQRQNDYSIYFYPEIKDLMDKEQANLIDLELKKLGYDDIEKFKSKRRIGENDSYICEMIRNDSVEEFISYLNKRSISIKNYVIEHSIFETNPYLISSKTSLFQYSAFFGSIQIFQYLQLNGAELYGIWEHAVHGQNAEIIHLIENCEEEHYCCSHALIEAVKCNHNDIVDYIINSYDRKIDSSFSENVIIYYNYQYFPVKESDDNLIFFCLYGYYKLVEFYLKDGKSDVNFPEIQKKFFFFLMQFKFIQF